LAHRLRENTSMPGTGNARICRRQFDANSTGETPLDDIQPGDAQVMSTVRR
jgi:hypothetical protein